MIKWLKRQAELEDIRLKYERLQYHLTRIIKAKTCREVDQCKYEIWKDRIITEGTEKKLLKLQESRYRAILHMRSQGFK